MFDALIVGAGFGGLAAALRLTELGARVCVCETLNYPGGCASTFERKGHRFESGATLFSGFDDDQLFGRFIARHKLPVRTRVLDPVVTLRAPGFALAVPPRRDELIDRLCALPDAPTAALRAFFAAQRQVADTLWTLFDDPALLPPFGARAFLRHLRSAPRSLALLPLLGKPLAAVLDRHGLAGFGPLRIYLDAVCQITVQASAAEAEAPFALAALDYFFRGTRHVEGGIGTLATAMAEAIRSGGGEVRFSERVRSVERGSDGFVARTRHGEVRARTVLLNLVPRAAASVLGVRTPELEARARRVEEGWGAAMLYVALPGTAALPETGPFHLQLVADPAQPFTHGNHLFCSVSGQGERGPERTATISTHVSLGELAAAPDEGAFIAGVQARMEETLRLRAPELCADRTLTMTASPRTFARFTGRPLGAVGGIPRTAGLRHYADLFLQEPVPDVFLVGDSVFPGQSTLAVALGGVKVAERVAGRTPGLSSAG